MIGIKHGFFSRSLPDRIQLVAAAVLQIAILVLVIGLFRKGLWLSAFTGALVFLLTFVPAILQHQLSLHLPVEFTFITTLFLYASFALGEVSGFYFRFWWWDLMLHSISSLTIGLIGFLMIYVFYMTHRVRIAPIYVALITLSLSVTTGVLWEIFEFSMDWFFDFNMQKSGLIDTMTDLMIDVLGGLVAAILGYLYVKNNDSLLVDRMVRHFTENNPRLFRRGQKRRRRRWRMRKNSL